MTHERYNSLRAFYLRYGYVPRKPRDVPSNTIGIATDSEQQEFISLFRWEQVVKEAEMALVSRICVEKRGNPRFNGRSTPRSAHDHR